MSKCSNQSTQSWRQGKNCMTLQKETTFFSTTASLMLWAQLWTRISHKIIFKENQLFMNYIGIISMLLVDDLYSIYLTNRFQKFIFFPFIFQNVEQFPYHVIHANINSFTTKQFKVQQGIIEWVDKKRIVKSNLVLLLIMLRHT